MGTFYRASLVANQRLVYVNCGLPNAYTLEDLYMAQSIDLNTKYQKAVGLGNDRLILQVTFGPPQQEPYQPLTQEAEYLLLSWTPQTLYEGLQSFYNINTEWGQMWIPPGGLNAGLGPMGLGTEKLYWAMWTTPGLKGLRMDLAIEAHSS